MAPILRFESALNSVAAFDCISAIAVGLAARRPLVASRVTVSPRKPAPRARSFEVISKRRVLRSDACP